MLRQLGAMILVGCWMACAACSPALAADRAADEAEIRRTAKDYLAALARGDRQALAGFWTADGDIMDESGRVITAAEATANVPAAVPNGAAPLGPVVELSNTRIRFLTADVALEDGTSRLAGAAGPEGRFSAVWVKQQGKWRLASLREARIAAPSIPERLSDLDWLEGNWQGTTADGLVEITAAWNPTHTFLLRDINLVRDGQVVFHGAQRIGWDPITRSIRSWVFDTDGGHGEGVWSKSGDGWVVEATGVLGDGRQTRSTTLYEPRDKDHFLWKTIAARSDGQPVADRNIEMIRKVLD